ncbi:GDP-mannose 4,6-dehydratase [Gemmatimonadota bacterium]
MPTIKGTSILVTGAAGFIGSHLAEKLVEGGARVRGLIHYNSRNDYGNLNWVSPDILNNIELLPGDIRDPFMVRKAVKDCDLVFHLAALIAIPYSYLAPESYFDTNAKGTLNILQACLDEGVEKVIHTSTSETYGTAHYTPIDENHPLQGQSPYSASKISADKIAESYHCSFDLPVATIRPFNTFGPRQSSRAIIPAIITQVLTGNELRLGSLAPVRDLTFVLDTVDGFLKVAGSDATIGEVVNTGTGTGISMGDLAKKIMEVMGKDVELIRDEQRIRPEKSEVMELVCDRSKAEALTGWSPHYSLETGLQETIDWIRDNLDSYQSERYTI